MELKDLIEKEQQHLEYRLSVIKRDIRNSFLLGVSIGVLVGTILGVVLL